MNIQTERLENHTARFTVEVDVDRLEKAKQSAARKIAKQVNIPGFRRGKAPYKILVNYVGEGAILEEAIEELGNEVYKDALGEADIDPYGMGQLEDFKVEPTPTFTFTVSLQPTVDLGDYRSIRLDYTPPTVEDEAVNRAMKLLQEQQAVVEESHQPVAIGNRVTLDLHSYFTDGKGAEENKGEMEGQPAAETAPESPESEHAHEHEQHEHAEESPAGGIHAHMHEEDDVFIHEHDLVVRLAEDDDPIAPGFKEALVGASVGDEREFELTFPDDEGEYEDLAGRKVKFHTVVKKIETMTLPALTDELAARLTQSEEKPLTLLELRVRVRENLQREAERQAKSNYANEVLDKIIDQAAIAFPEDLVIEQTETLLNDLDRRLRQQGLTLEDYYKVSNKSKGDLMADYREPAIGVVRHSLVLLELVRAENVTIADQDIDQQINAMLVQFGEQAAGLRQAFDTPQMRSNIANDLIQEKVMDRIAEIAMGKAPSQPSPEATSAPSETTGESAEQASSPQV